MPRILKAITSDHIDWTECEQFAPGAGEIRVISEFSAAKHGTELAMYQGKGRHRGNWDSELQLHAKDNTVNPEPGNIPLGNATVGEVVEAGPDTDGYRVGDRVLIREVPFSEEHVVPVSSCDKLNDSVPWQSAVCVDPAIFAMGAVRDGHVRLGDRVAVFGLGAIGLMLVQLLMRAGIKNVVAFDPIEQRRDIAREFGILNVMDPVDCDAGKETKLTFGGHGADVCIDFSGNVHALQSALRAVAFGGVVVCGAFPGPYPAGLDLGAEAHMNIPKIIFSRACSSPDRDYPRWHYQRIKDTCLGMLVNGELTGEPIVSPIVDFEELPAAYPEIVPDPRAGIKLGVRHK